MRLKAGADYFYAPAELRSSTPWAWVKAWLADRNECNNHDSVHILPSCTRPAFDVEMSSRAIDFEVRRRVNEGAPFYYIDTELTTGLDPDLLVAQEHCDVCAPDAGRHCRERLRRFGETSLSKQWRSSPRFGEPTLHLARSCHQEVGSYLSIFGRIDNLTNERYSEVFGFPALGRAAYGGVKVRF